MIKNVWYTIFVTTVAGISCPRGARPLPGGETSKSEPYGDEALAFTKEMCLQREVITILIWKLPLKKSYH